MNYARGFFGEKFEAVQLLGHRLSVGFFKENNIEVIFVVPH